MNKTVTTKYITENIHQTVRHDLFENRTLRRYLEPLPQRDHPLYSPIIPYGVLIEQELDEIQIHWTPQYLPYYIDDGLIAPTSAEFIRAFLENYQETEEDIDEEWNTPYPSSKSKYHYEIPAIWTYSRTNRPNQDNSTLPLPVK